MNTVLLAIDPAFFTSPAFALAVFFVVIVAYSFIAKMVGDKKAPAATELPAAKAPEKALPAKESQGTLELIETDEKTAAVIMAIVSNKSGIPLNRLSFKSIRLMEDNK